MDNPQLARFDQISEHTGTRRDWMLRLFGVLCSGWPLFREDPKLLVQIFQSQTASGVLYDGERDIDADYSDYHYLGWILGMFALVALVGFPFGCALFIFLFIQKKVGNSPLTAPT